MDPTVAVSIAGLLATSGTAIWLRSLDNRRHARQLAHERALADRNRLREVLDDGAAMMRRVVWTQWKLVDSLRARDGDRIDEVGAVLTELTEDASLVVGRLALLIGLEHEVTRAYEAMSDILVKTSKELYAELPSGAAKYAVRTKHLAGQMEAILGKAEDEFRPARRRFIESARGLVGADLSALLPAATQAQIGDGGGAARLEPG